MKALILASVLVLGGCSSMTSVRTVHGPTVMPVPHNNPSIQPELPHMEVPFMGKAMLLGLVAGAFWVLWRWDDD